MGKAADMGAIHYRMLNGSRGHAVRGPRTQQDRQLYKLAVQEILNDYNNLTIIEDEVEDLSLRTDDTGVRVDGVKLRTGTMNVDAVVLSTGTFLGGRCLIGKERFFGGRLCRLTGEFEKPANQLSDTLKRLNLPISRFKTGTPPRLYRNSIDFSKLQAQESDIPFAFSYINTQPKVLGDKNLILCHLVRTNEQVKEIVLKNLDKLPEYHGGGLGNGPRYCPSIASKFVRFPNANDHIIWLEPEGLDSDIIYPNGISGAFPPEIQEKIMHSMPGLANVKVKSYAYDVEYDYINPRCLRHSLECIDVKGLYLAGQIIGTTGYEEAAALGLIAGTNAALNNGPPFVIERTMGYIGVLVDDLVRKGVSEPYRMFTSRAEYRLSLRYDNADLRLTPLGIQIGLVRDRERIDMIKEKSARSQACLDRLNSFKIGGDKAIDSIVSGHESLQTAENKIFASMCDGFELNNTIVESDIDIQPNYDMLFTTLDEYRKEIGKYINTKVPPWCCGVVESTIRYSPYIQRDYHAKNRLKRVEEYLIPPEISYTDKQFNFLSAEEIEILQRHKPRCLKDMLEIQGITPASVTMIASLIFK
ncbi:tRNA uridine 5-carboxymethylaminomethyl modification enzyme MnmG [Babesia microti strain RI]|uniref:tRNA uridine 5-carboxymethylaminomethyl modification enzyme MnmG n=1 Tax=Babesia microti (strain RI) TaxID=1133968 RepID=A0A1N6LYA3_BABMR|nr:tRNA uridine 5-carboxymethylaminomethyl modification enzyme MnmG [Babesia microti strain RI]SIO73858.1 tRNA uridine 5-carboxymethylaminomethyl modification enzyme MnmG [Babesia microti strain RI]|eukprot:XP_021337911.1 tRNA uridine 5-carboxymethylaminomethyl modification enzyme MnmG [Babesia microti strain RI]